MASNDTLLLLFSYSCVVAFAMLLVVPILRRQSDLFTTWNSFLVGGILFTGLSGVRCSAGAHYLKGYTSSDYFLYMTGVVVVYTVAAATYYFVKWPRKLAGGTQLTWPPLSGTPLALTTIVLAAMVALQTVFIPIPFIGQMISQIAGVAPLIALTCAFVAWYRSPRNILLLGLLLLAIVASLYGAVAISNSRRTVINSLACIPVAYYWIQLRYRSTGRILATIALAAAVTLPVLMGFSAIRRSTDAKFGVGRFVEIVQTLPQVIRRGGSSEGLMGQDAVECALLTIHMLNDGSDRLEVDPLATLVYIAVNPIPRSVWPGKPEELGYFLQFAADLYDLGIAANLGVNISGQCFYDGGLAVHVLYGFLLGAFFRYFDELLVRQAGNPIVIATYVAMNAYIITLSRGGLGTIGLQVVWPFVVMILLRFTLQVVFGTGMRYPRTGHLVRFPVLRSPQDWARWMGSYTAVVTPPRPRRMTDD